MKSMKFALELRSAFAQYSPRVLQDSTDDGEECAELIFDGDGEKLHISVTVRADGDACALWLGGVCIGDEVPAGQIKTLLSALLDDKVAVVSGYRNINRYEAKEPYFERIFLLDGESEELDRLIARLKKPKGLFGRLWSGDGIYVLSKYSGKEVINGKNP
ncbi:MAG: hypothetical protein E7589_01135 [Ruminococcaceae bacterium]|nr:hypothetical protein [Oscillospiraceae bacterium]